MDNVGGGCLAEFSRRPSFYKANSAVLWHQSPGTWRVLQREGFPDACLSLGGRFYFTLLASNVLTADLGVCLPEQCSPSEITWEALPALYQSLFFSRGDLRFGLQLREHRSPAWEAAPEGAAACALLAALLLALGAVAPRAAAPPEHRAWAPLQACVTLGLVLEGVALRTRWRAQRWHEERSALLGAARELGALAAEALAVLRLLRAASAVGGAAGGAAGHETQEAHGAAGRRCLRALAALVARVARLALLGFAWAAAARLVQSTLTVNVFSDQPWLRPGWTESMVACANAPMAKILFAEGLEGVVRGVEEHALTCPHLVSVMEELRCTCLAAPVLLLGAVLGTKLAAVLAMLTVWSMWASDAYGAALHVVACDFVVSSAVVFAVAAENQHRRLYFGVALAAVSAAVLLMYASDPTIVTATMTMLKPMTLALGLQLAAGMLPVATSLDESAACAVPAIPLVIFVLEGYAEPHAKLLTSYDFWVRVVGVFGLCILGGAAVMSIWRGLVVAAIGTVSLIRTFMQWRLRVTIEGSTEVCSCRIPMLVIVLALCCTAALTVSLSAIPASD